MKNWKGTKKKPFKVVDMADNELAIINTEQFPTYAAHVYFNDEEGQANAHLISEAFNVVNETGYTPNQLAEQNKELLEALKDIKAAMIFGNNPNDKGLIEIAEAAIANAEK